MVRITKFITRFFPLWVIICATIAYFYPQPIIDSKLSGYISFLLGVVMLGMGLTMSLQDFKMVLVKPWLILLGVAMRCVLMPLIAFSLAHLLHLPDAIAVGLILVGCCPSGTASNVITFLAKGDTALSVTLTSFITLLSPVLTPVTFFLLAGSYIEVDVVKMFYDIILIVILPVAIGVFLHTIMPQVVDKIRLIVPILSIVAIVVIIMAIIAGNARNLAIIGPIAFIAVVLHNGIGLACGYWFSRFFGLSIPQSKAISFEIGMENSGLAVVLASTALGNPAAALPGAIFSVWHNLSGSVLASYWAGKTDKQK